MGAQAASMPLCTQKGSGDLLMEGVSVAVFDDVRDAASIVSVREVHVERGACDCLEETDKNFKGVNLLRIASFDD